ncbi:tetratricopeptide repeat protein [Thiovibrio frasassiensis]|uniref:Tetratricopeptide repeat protein n=1 Tax=Thiovibrio frasassiensis TaxID=2984131 RepID=A0A9X4MCI9_9BACT|nr:tetratricopeptide repeat protein [Thiovibrio frasassiensis]MDG4474916.1 tetratricopeptide repeat protein [Thiovibrio frasassiensis]
MSRLKALLAFTLSFSIIAALPGCAPMDSGGSQPKDVIPAGYTYHPKPRPEIVSPEAAKKDLAALLAGSKNPGIKYHGQPGLNNSANEEALTAFIRGKSGPITFWYDPQNELLFMAFSGSSALDDRIEVHPRILFFYADLLDQPIVVIKTTEWPSWGRHVVEKNMEGIVRPYKIHFPGLMSFVFEGLPDAQRFADDLFVIQQALQKKHDERLALFQAKATQYRGMKVKPPVSEEQRKYIVQANALNQRKEYAGAIDLYSKVIDVDPVSFPPAYFNLALLCAQMQRFQPAIAYMKQYLLLVPDANDARAAQDKIYEWELK